MSKHPPISVIVNSAEAARILHKALPSMSVSSWTTWLANNRSPKRKSRQGQIPFTRVARAIHYDRKDLDAFIEFERMRKVGTIELTGRAGEVAKAFGLGTASGSATGRRMKVASITAQVDEVAGGVFMQVILDDPLMVYRLSPKEAEGFAFELLDATRALDRITAKAA